jgi:hypothetical protein
VAEKHLHLADIEAGVEPAFGGKTAQAMQSIAGIGKLGVS